MQDSGKEIAGVKNAAEEVARAGSEKKVKDRVRTVPGYIGKAGKKVGVLRKKGFVEKALINVIRVVVLKGFNKKRGYLNLLAGDGAGVVNARKLAGKKNDIFVRKDSRAAIAKKVKRIINLLKAITARKAAKKG